MEDAGPSLNFWQANLDKKLDRIKFSCIMMKQLIKALKIIHE